MNIKTVLKKYNLLRTEIIPFLPEDEKSKGKGFYYKDQEFVHHSGLHHKQTAFHRLSGLQIFIFTTLFIDFLLGLIITWHTTLVLLFAVLTILYFADLLFNLYLIYRSFKKPEEIQITQDELKSLDEDELPSYTVFCPLYKEWQVLPQFITAMSRLEYPKDRLQVMLLLEEDDTETIEHIKNYNLPEYFEIVVVPHSLPKTKPKACNYGLLHAKGEYTVIYDAEDVPETQQLKKAIIAFKKADDRTICVQAKLNFYNPYQNLLTRIFTAEYSLWFDLVLTGLQSIHAPIPLGGTSNHFRTLDLHKLKGWDSFNVTEDADLGMRLVKQGYRTAIIDSETLEEANSGIRNWFWQRTRWIKGYMQTYLVHMRDPRDFLKNWKEPHVITFQLVIGGKILSMFINPLMWIITIAYFLFRAHIGKFIESFFPISILYMAVTSLLLGNFLYMYYYMVGCKKHGHHDLVKYAIFVPFYWLAMSVAAWVAFYELLVAPHHWSKTKHGLHLKNKKAVIDASKAVGNKLVNEELTKLNPSRVSTDIKDHTVSGISIVLPAYNEAENIASTVQRVDQVMISLSLDYEIIVVNDGSKDNSKELLQALLQKYKNLRVVNHSTNRGYGSALRSGFNGATKDWIFFMDSDRQFDIAEISNLLPYTNKADIIIGFRKERQDTFIRLCNAKLFNLTIRTLFGLRVRDIDCAFKLFKREVVVKNPLSANGALINTELLVRAKQAGYRIVEVGVSHYPRIKGNPTGANISVIFRAVSELITFKITNTI